MAFTVEGVPFADVHYERSAGSHIPFTKARAEHKQALKDAGINPHTKTKLALGAIVGGTTAGVIGLGVGDVLGQTSMGQPLIGPYGYGGY